MPSICEATAKFVLTNPSRTPVAGFFVAEAKEEVAPAGHHNVSNAGYESSSVGVVEDVEQPAVEHRVELFAQSRQDKGVPHFEANLEGALRRLFAGQSDGGWGGVDPRRLEPAGCSHESVLARPTPDVEHTTPDLARVDHSHKRALGSADVPRWRISLVGGVEIVRHPPVDGVPRPVIASLTTFKILRHHRFIQ